MDPTIMFEATEVSEQLCDANVLARKGNQNSDARTPYFRKDSFFYILYQHYHDALPPVCYDVHCFKKFTATSFSKIANYILRRNYACMCILHHCVPTDIDECASDPCGNGGSCSDEVDSYTCNCYSGYEGVNCETGTWLHR